MKLKTFGRAEHPSECSRWNPRSLSVRKHQTVVPVLVGKSDSGVELALIG